MLTGRHGMWSSYEAFAQVVDSMLTQHAKWLEQCHDYPWRRPLASLNVLLTSHARRNDHNGSVSSTTACAGGITSTSSPAGNSRSCNGTRRRLGMCGRRADDRDLCDLVALAKYVPGIKVRVVNVVDRTALMMPADHPHGMDNMSFDALSHIPRLRSAAAGAVDLFNRKLFEHDGCIRGHLEDARDPELAVDGRFQRTDERAAAGHGPSAREHVHR